MLTRTLTLAIGLSLASTSVFSQDLFQTYELARQNDPQLAIAESNRLSTREGAVQARAALLPQVGGSVGLNRQHAAGVSGTTRSRNYSATLGQSIFDWGAISSLRAQREVSTAADYTLDAANGELITRTAGAYFDVLVAHETLVAAEAAETAFQKQFDFANKRLEVGMAPIMDVHEARAQYDSARANTILARNALQDALQALTDITNTPVATLKALPEDFAPELPSGGSAEQWVALAEEHNPVLQAGRHSIRASEHALSATRAAHLPTLSLGATYSNNTGWLSTTPGLGQTNEGNTLGLTLNIPLFSGGGTQSRVRQAIASRDIAQDQFEQNRRSVERSTLAAWRALVAGISEVEARRLAVVSAQSAYDASQVGLEVGQRTIIDVLINQQNLFSARQAYAQARYNYLRNRLNLGFAVGTLSASDVQDINRLLSVDVNAVQAAAQR